MKYQDLLDLITPYEREFKKWEGQVEKIIKRYKDEYRQGTRGYTEARFNILWSNVQTIVPAVYSRLPKPDVSRRYSDRDPVGRVASLILERALEFEIQHYPDYSASMRQSVYDRFLGGRGTAWVRYEPHFRAAEEKLPEDGVQVTEDVDEAEKPQEVLDYECAPTDYVHWRDFGHAVARTWEEVTTVWRKVYMSRDALIERFGDELGKKVPLDCSPEDLKKGSWASASDNNSQALIYEIWDKPSGKAYWLSKSMGEILDERDDPLQVEGFFPCPRPLYATITNETLVPVPDFKLYQDQATELDVLCDRIDGLIKALQVKGVYDSAIPELARLFTEGENNTLIPVKNFQAFAEKNGLKGSIDLIDILPIAQALNEAYKAMEQIKAQVYEITGISDIIRGQSAASETATAQQIKGQYASLRLKSLQDDVARYATDILRLKAQVMCQQFSPTTLLKMSGADQLNEADIPAIPDAIKLLRNRVLRTFRVEVQADSLVQMDEREEQQARTEFLAATGGFLQQAGQMAVQVPEATPLLLEMLKFGVTAFKVGKSLEGQFDQFAEQFKQQQAQPKPPKPDPEMMKVQAQQQADQMRMQADQQANAARLQADQANKQAALQLEQQKHQMQLEADARSGQLQLQLEQQKHALETQANSQIEIQKMDLEWKKALLQAETTVTVAAISAKQPGTEGAVEKAEEGLEQSISPQIAQIVEGFKQAINQPKQVVRDEMGRVVGIQTVQ